MPVAIAFVQRQSITISVKLSFYVFLGSGEILQKTYSAIVQIITNLEWKIKEKEEHILGIEHAGMHMILKKLIQHDKVNLQTGSKTFGEALLKNLNSDLVSYKIF